MNDTNMGGDPTNADDAILDEFSIENDEEIKNAGNDPEKLRELLIKRTETRQKLYARAKNAEKEAKALKEANKGKEDKGEASKTGEKGKTIEFGYGEEAYLLARGYTEESQIEFIKNAMKESGRNLKDVLSSSYVQSELKSLAEQKATEDASIKDSKRGGEGSKSSVDYWIKKGELPPESQSDLRRKVVLEKTRLAKEKQKFGA